MKNTGTIIVIVLVLVLAIFLFGGIGMMGIGRFGMMGPGMMGPGMMGGYGGHGGMMSGYGFNPLHMIISFIVWALVIGGIILIVLWSARNANRVTSSASPESPLDILKTRYARGEISKEQFDAMRQDLVAS